MNLRAGCTLFFLAAVAVSSRAECTAQLAHGPVKIRPHGPLSLPPPGPLVCARNETCSFQVVITATRRGCRVEGVRLSEFTSAAGRLAPPITVYRQALLNVFFRSNEQGDIGEWPDALIPAADPEFAETRNAFPVYAALLSRAYKRYRLRGGHTLPAASAGGLAVAGGNYSGALDKRIQIEIVQGGAVGRATYVWWSDPGPGMRSAPRTTSFKPEALEDGLTIAFDGRGHSDDFVTGDQFWVFAGPARRLAFWVDVSVPADAAAGLFSSTVEVSVADSRPQRLPVELRVADFALDSTSSLPTHFGANWRSIARAHFGNAPGQREPPDASTLEMGRLYARAALRNSITLEGGKEFAPVYSFSADGRLLPADYSAYDRAVGDFLDGRGTPGGARWTSLRLPDFAAHAPAQRIEIIRDFARHARERGWLERLFALLFDEPRTAEQFAELRRNAEMLRAAGPSITRLASTDLNPALEGLVQRWAPVVNHLAPRSLTPREAWRNRHFPRRAAYESRLRAGDSLWWYHSCLSHGCSETGRSPGNDNWPTMVVDSSAAANRVFGFLTAVNYSIGGMLYWDVAFAHARSTEMPGPGVDVWDGVYYFGGNGDGSLFYPGRPEQIGGTRHIPIESLRLKFVRDSLVDAEYARLLEQAGEGEFLRREVSRVIQKAYVWDADPQAWLDLRARLAERIEHTRRRPSVPPVR